MPETALLHQLKGFSLTTAEISAARLSAAAAELHLARLRPCPQFSETRPFSRFLGHQSRWATLPGARCPYDSSSRRKSSASLMASSSCIEAKPRSDHIQRLVMPEGARLLP